MRVVLMVDETPDRSDLHFALFSNRMPPHVLRGLSSKFDPIFDLQEIELGS